MATFDRYDDAIGLVNQVTANLQLRLVEKNSARISSLAEFYRNAISNKRRSEHFDPRHAVENLSFEILNWLTATRLFLDHHYTSFSNIYGKDSPQYRRLKEAIASEYDASAAYRVLYKFRDYTQHCGFPMDQVNLKASDPSRNNWRAQVEFTAGRERLLAEFDWKSKVRTDLESMPERIDVLELIEEASPCFRRIFAEISRVRTRGVAGPDRNDARGRATLRRIRGDTPCCKLRNGQRNDQVYNTATSANRNKTARPGPSEYLERFAMDNGDERIEKFMKPAALNFATQQALAVGVDIMSTYYEAGGIGPHFASSVNRIANELGNVGPVVDGITTLAAVGLAMAGAALGTDAREIMGNITADLTDSMKSAK